MIRQLEGSINSHRIAYCEAVQKHYEEYGDLLIPYKYTTREELQLGAWIWTPGQGSLTAEQIRKLESIGMVWQGMHEYDWENAFAKARSYYEQNGDLNVPADYRAEGGYALLGVWLSNQRQKARKSLHGKKLSEERLNQLESIGMEWKETPAASD